MVKKVEAWADSSGTVHTTEESARKADFFATVKDITKAMLPPLTDDQLLVLWRRRFDLVPLIIEIKGEPHV